MRKRHRERGREREGESERGCLRGVDDAFEGEPVSRAVNARKLGCR